MEDGKWIKTPCIEVTQPIGTFYVASIDCTALVRITWVDVRRILSDDREVEVLSGIQRELSPKRVAELKKYVNNVDASFPTAIILAIDSENAEYDPDTKTLTIRDDGFVAKVIDGQHRIYGLHGYSGRRFELNVTVFIDMDMEDQALLFATINLKQTVVTKSLAYDLYDFAKTRSPQKTCHNIAQLLNHKTGSPFYKRIMTLGKATRASQTLTQAAFIDSLIGYISRDPMSDRDVLRRHKDLPLAPGEEIRVKKLIFRNLFIKDKDAEIARILWNYFSAVASRWPTAWNEKQPGIILNRTTGFRALMRFLPIACLTSGPPDTIVPEEKFREIFKEVKLTDGDFTPDNFKPGSSGQGALFKQFCSDTGLTESSIWQKKQAQ